MIRRLLTAICLAAAVTAAAAALPVTLSSPDGRLTFSLEQRSGHILYDVNYCGRPVITRGRLGVDVDNHLVEAAMGIPADTARLWTEHFRLTTVDTTAVDTTFTPPYGEYATLRCRYRQAVFHFAKGDGGGDDGYGYNKRSRYLFDIVVRAYDEGIALRYRFPESPNGLFMHVTADLTTFAFSPEATAWHEAWAQGPYSEVPLQCAALTADGRRVWNEESERPLYLSLPGGLKVVLAEAGLHDFVRGKLRLVRDGELQMSLYGSADVIPPYAMPWRVIMVGRRPVDLINNKQIILSLNDPCRIADTGFIRPGKAFRSSRLSDEGIRRSIDFAARFGLQYVELDAGWYGPEMKMSSSALAVGPGRDFSIPDICAYAASKGVGIWLYVNQRALYTQLDSILPLYRKWGVKGLKFGFVQVGSQQWTTWLHQAVAKCARYGLMVDIHDEYRPTGWSRTYPNLLTQEGVRGNEEMPDARHNTVLPFTRYIAGPADYTLCYFNSRVKPTKAHQLAMAVVYYSPLQFMFWYDSPEAYRGERELDFWRHCPTVWDYSEALSGEPGEYIVQARRSGTQWYVGVMNGPDSRRITLDTSLFLDKGKSYTAEIYTDDPSLKTRTNVRTEVCKIKAGKKIDLNLLPQGGAAIRFVPLADRR